MNSLEFTQEEILTKLRSSFAQQVIEQSIEDAIDVPRNQIGDINPYFAVQFGDVQARGARNMAIVKGDDYQLPVYIQCLAPSPDLARKMYSRLVDVLLGYRVTYGGPIRKIPGGMMWPLAASDSGAEVYVRPASFAVPFQFMTVL